MCRFYFFFGILFLMSCQEQSYYQQHRGDVFGTNFSIQYESDSSHLNQIREIFRDFNQSLSTYDSTSLISQVNRNEEVEIDAYFQHVLEAAQIISSQTKGAFDMTASPLISAWGFGAHKKNLKEVNVDSLLCYVGMQHIHLEGNRIRKDFPHLQLDGNAISKGYAVDVIAAYLSQNNIQNFLIDIGGEIRTKGVNRFGKVWTLALNKPIDDSTATVNELQQDLVLLSGHAIATSGNYRQFYIKDEQKYAHTISPLTGYPVAHNLLSASVIDSSCMYADGYATAFMVLGVEESKKLADSLQIPIYLIYENEQGKDEVYISDSFRNFLKNEKTK